MSVLRRRPFFDDVIAVYGRVVWILVLGACGAVKCGPSDAEGTLRRMLDSICFVIHLVHVQWHQILAVVAPYWIHYPRKIATRHESVALR